jgi:hypothetical protein
MAQSGPAEVSAVTSAFGAKADCWRLRLAWLHTAAVAFHDGSKPSSARARARRRRDFADAQKIVAIWERAPGWRGLLASLALHVFRALPLSFDLLALCEEVVE